MRGQLFKMNCTCSKVIYATSKYNLVVPLSTVTVTLFEQLILQLSDTETCIIFPTHTKFHSKVISVDQRLLKKPMKIFVTYIHTAVDTMEGWLLLARLAAFFLVFLCNCLTG